MALEKAYFALSDAEWSATFDASAMQYSTLPLCNADFAKTFATGFNIPTFWFYRTWAKKPIAARDNCIPEYLSKKETYDFDLQKGLYQLSLPAYYPVLEKVLVICAQSSIAAGNNWGLIGVLEWAARFKHEKALHFEVGREAKG